MTEIELAQSKIDFWINKQRSGGHRNTGMSSWTKDGYRRYPNAAISKIDDGGQSENEKEIQKL